MDIAYEIKLKLETIRNLPTLPVVLEKARQVMNDPQSDAKRLAKIIEDGKIVVRPVIIVKIKISGEIKDVEMIVTDDTTHSIVLGRSDLKDYLIDTSKTFK